MCFVLDEHDLLRNQDGSISDRWVSPLSEQKRRSCLLSVFVTASLICGLYYVGTAIFSEDNAERLSGWQLTYALQKTESSMCQSNSKSSKNLLAMAVGIKQKESVDHIVRKFRSSDFVVMLFHYDVIIDEWKDLEWNNEVIHISAMTQTKWWFAKRFLHPDIVAEYNYIFLWDEDLGVEDFHPDRYLAIIKDEGLEISQPALDPKKSEVHHQITARQRKSVVHRRIFKTKGSGRCTWNSTAPPCVGWVEMMAPVFSRAAWRCAWYMIQGDRTKNVGVVDSEYVVHLGLPTLGGLDNNKEPPKSNKTDNRPAVRRQSFIEMQIFRDRWHKAVEEDKCWVDPYQQS
ncbi:Protein of unknown function DUF707 [Dillenia turbinata]|uniref:Uncharacterized protein n=1 Tax=Dillenia turbinata TaxID=194707 RepID=A0AAN8YWW2_9MAGN